MNITGFHKFNFGHLGEPIKDFIKKKGITNQFYWAFTHNIVYLKKSISEAKTKAMEKIKERQ